MPPSGGFFIPKEKPNPNISIEGKMNTKDAGRVAVIMAYGKAISLILGSLAGLIVAVVGLIKLTMGM